MARGLPRTIWRATMWELVKLLVLTAGVSVTVLAFGAAIKPLSDGKLDVVDALRFIGYASVPMLAYALPFAGGFASTLAYHRMAQDNELSAAQAGGVSLRLLLVPAVVVGLALAGVLAGLNEQVIPRLLREMYRLVTVDMGKLLEIEVSKGRSVALPWAPVQISADEALRRGRDPESGAADRISLSRPLMIETDAEGSVTRVASASRADMWFFPSGQGEGQSRLHVRLQQAVSLNPSEPAAKYQFDEKVEGDIPVPAFSRDRTKFRTFGELRELLRVPEGMDRVAMPKRDLAMQLAERQALAMIGESLASRGRVVLLDEGGREVVVRGSRLEWVKDGWVVVPPKGGDVVEVELVRAGPGSRSSGVGGEDRRLVLRARAARLAVSVAPSGTKGGVELGLTLERVRTFSAGDAEVGGERASLPVSGLALAGLDEESFVSRGCEELLAEADRRAEDPGLASAGAKLRWEIARLRHDVRAKQRERWAMAASCFAMVVTGAVTAVRLSRSQPLTVYLWTFFPALGCLVTISGGQQTMRDGSMLGGVILWAGVLALLVYALVVYRRLARH